MPSTDVYTEQQPPPSYSSTAARWSKYTMPVLSPRRSVPSALTGSYRTTYSSSSSIDRPYYGGSINTYTPRSASYISRSYSTSSTTSTVASSVDNSVRDKSMRRDSVEPSSNKSSASSVAESVAELRNRYSPANYVPTILRTKTNDSCVPRSKSIVADDDVVGVRKKDLSTSPRPNRSLVPTGNVDRYRSDSGGGGGSLERDNDLCNGTGTKPTTTTIATSNVRSLGLNGLKNIGNTCFMNSVIQCLSNTRLLMEYVKGDAYVNDINTTNSSMRGVLMKAFGNVIKELWSEDNSCRVNTMALKNQIQRFAPRFMGYSQQDAQEFLRYLLEGLHEDVNRVTVKPTPIHTEIDENLSDADKASEAWQRYLRIDNSRIVDIFVGQLKSTLRCTHCGHCSVTFDPFWDLSLPLPARHNQLRLSQCLDHFTREETLDGYEKPTCSRCKERRKCTKSFSIQKFPKILVIHLKRFSPTERFRGKLNATVDFPLEGLDLRAYAAADCPSECRYNLYAISNHSGMTYSGHYTAYCRHPYTLAWYSYNDSRVSSISSKNIVSSEAYVLFYELESQKSHL